jgi:3-oxoacyl-[acyl-carrier-protein] synthase-3
MTNDEWSRYVDTTDAWIQERTGIRERRIADAEESTADLALAAARLALEDARVAPEELDEIIIATDTREVMIPDTASYVQHRLGAGEIPAYDLAGSGCAGFLQGLDIARSRVLGGKEKVLVVGVELLTRLMDWTDRNTCVLFGDAAGACIVGSGEKVAQILGTVAGTDGSRAEILMVEMGGTRVPFSLEGAKENLHRKVVMKGREVFREAVRRMSEAARKLLEQTGYTVRDLALAVPHQANLRILKAVGAALSLPADKLYINVERYGNTGSASVPLALWEARSLGRVRPGDLVLLVSFGAGFHWAASLVRF